MIKDVGLVIGAHHSKPLLPLWYMRPMGSGGNSAACLMRRSADEDGAQMCLVFVWRSLVFACFCSLMR